MKVLVINTYAGSLLLAARAAGLEVTGSFEDSGFGQDVARLNFPEVPMVKTIAEWPDRDLSKTVVIAHPPCAAFSNQNNVASARGVDTDAFKCHKNVMKYALSQKCVALAMESVPAAMEAARAVHDAYGKRYGYNVYRILQNACTFGLPQWRPRFWVVFLKADEFRVHHTPEYRSVEVILRPKGTITIPSRESEIVFDRMTKGGWPRKKIEKWLDEPGSLLQIAARKLDIDDVGPNHEVVRTKLNLHGMFGCYMPRVLDPTGFATTVLLDSTWYCHGRPLFVEEYNQIMGFPEDYKFGDRAKQFRMYLSKGVCPPVAAWLLEQIRQNLERDWKHQVNHVLHPGETLDLQPKKADALKQVRQRKLFV
jgi:site-specific DNA-cytosine methylase